MIQLFDGDACALGGLATTRAEAPRINSLEQPG